MSSGHFPPPGETRRTVAIFFCHRGEQEGWVEGRKKSQDSSRGERALAILGVPGLGEPGGYRHLFAEIRTLAIKGDDGCSLTPCPTLAFTNARTGAPDFKHDQDLRDTCVMLLDRSGSDLLSICDVTGHSYQSAQTIMKHYRARNAARADAAIDRLVAFMLNEGMTFDFNQLRQDHRLAEVLLRCPFCNGEAESYFNEGYFRVQCHGCGCQTNGFGAETSARISWNKRA